MHHGRLANKTLVCYRFSVICGYLPGKILRCYVISADNLPMLQGTGAPTDGSNLEGFAHMGLIDDLLA